VISTESSVKRGGIRPEEVTFRIVMDGRPAVELLRLLRGTINQHIRRSPELEQLEGSLHYGLANAGVDSYHCDWDKE